MDTQTDYGSLHKLFDENFLDYTSYVIKERAIPDVTDGLKPVQRRIMQTLFAMDDGRFSKVANVVGETMKLHPHGDQSIFGALVNLANKGYLIERQGNFGNIYTGDGPSAARYIECRLTPLARETLFNKDLTEYVDSYDGRNKEPVVLPAKLPLLLLQGADGIAVGMATKILPHNFCELLAAQKKILKNEPFQVFPDFPQGGLMDVSGYEDGNGRIRCRAKIVEKNDKTIVIKEIPYGTTTGSLMDSIEKAAKSGKIKIISINDYTAEEVEVEIKLARGLYAQDTIRALYAFTDCEVSISPNLTAIRDNRPVTLSVADLLRFNTAKLKNDLERQLVIDLDRLREKLHAHLLEQIFIEERLYKEIEECESYPLVVETVEQSLLPFRERLVRDVSREDIERLLEIRIRRISRYDIDKKRRDIKETENAIRQVEKDLKDMVAYSLRYLDKLLATYGPLYPRRTEIATFSEVEARKVALCNLTVGYHQESGFLGHQIKTDCDRAFACSEYDKILLIFTDGTYKVINVADKVFVGSGLAWCGAVDEKLVFNVVYRDADEGLSYIKRFRCPKFILEKEYHLFGGNKKSTVQFLSLGEGGCLRIHYKPSRRAKKNFEDVALDEILIKNAAAKGKRVSTRPVRKIVELAEKADAVEGGEPKLPTLFGEDKK
ncbi:MAG: DNA topoisomerase IV subunit A [Thermodesulfobacteriota bacterium]